MNKIVLPPRNYYSSSKLTDPQNMLTGVGSTTYTSAPGTVFLYDFDFSEVPSWAIVKKISIKVKVASRSSVNLNFYAVSDYNNINTVIVAAGSYSGALTSNLIYTHTYTGTTIDYNTLSSYNRNFSLCLTFAINSGGSVRPALQIYGAEIDIEFSMPLYHKKEKIWRVYNNVYKNDGNVWARANEFAIGFDLFNQNKLVLWGKSDG